MPTVNIHLAAPDSAFSLELGDPVVISASGEPGEVVGRAEYAKGEPTYHVEYRRPDGVYATAWFRADQLTP